MFKYDSIKTSIAGLEFLEEISQKAELKKRGGAIETKGNKIKRIRSPISNEKECWGGWGGMEKTRQEMCVREE